MLRGCFLVLCFNRAACLVPGRVHSRAAIPFEVVLASVMLVRRGFEIEYLNTFLRVSQGGPRRWDGGMGEIWPFISSFQLARRSDSLETRNGYSHFRNAGWLPWN